MSLNGKIIVIEGTDGSGKQTQAKYLKERLEKEGYEVYSTSFPNYDSDSSAAVRMYLNGEIRKDANEISAKAASIFYAVDRYITYKKEMEQVYKEGKKVIVLDRWVASNIIHQGAKLMETEGSKTLQLEKFVAWLNGIEYYDFEVPKADMTIYLNVPIEYTIKLREARANKITGGEKQDIHESDNTHLINASTAGLIAADEFCWNVIECVKDDKMRTIEDIADEIWQLIKQKFGG